MANSININASKVFKTWNFRFVDKPLEIIVDSIAVMIGDYSIYRKRAAILLLKALLKDDFRKFLFEDEKIYPIDREDARVRKWKKEVLSKGKCEKCGSQKALEAHHIIHWADYPLGRFDIKNGECLCHECHTEEHHGDPSYYMMKAKCS